MASILDMIKGRWALVETLGQLVTAKRRKDVSRSRSAVTDETNPALGRLPSKEDPKTMGCKDAEVKPNRNHYLDPQCSSIKGPMVSIRWSMGYLKE